MSSQARCVNISNSEEDPVNMCVDSTGMICTYEEDGRLPISGNNWTQVGIYQSATDPTYGDSYGSLIYDDITTGYYTNNIPGDIKPSLLTTDGTRFKPPVILRKHLEVYMEHKMIYLCKMTVIRAWE